MAGCGRVVYNDSLYLMLEVVTSETGIADRKALYDYPNKRPPKERIAFKKPLSSCYSLSRLPTDWKRQANRNWLAEAYAASLQQRQCDLSKAVDE